MKEEKENLDPIIKEKLTSRALKANEDIKDGRVYCRKKAEAKLKKRMGICGLYAIQSLTRHYIFYN
ncbi:MAG TPA: hypothetical protein PKL31_11960 [Fulvivirga sp.]|nr:hypothetical protein [Fulvivirga sp.]